MSKGDFMFVSIEPKDELVLNYIPLKYIESKLKLVNITESYVGYKIKTNNPKSYLVKPHTDFLSPGKSVDVSIMMHPSDFKSGEFPKDKFLVTAIQINQSELTDPKVWEKYGKTACQEAKIKVSFNLINSDMTRSTPVNKPDSSARSSLMDMPTDASFISQQSVSSSRASLSQSQPIKVQSKVVETIEKQPEPKIIEQPKIKAPVQNFKQEEPVQQKPKQETPSILKEPQSVSAKSTKSISFDNVIDNSEKARPQTMKSSPTKKISFPDIPEDTKKEDTDKIEARINSIVEETNNLKREKEVYSLKESQQKANIFKLSEDRAKMVSELEQLKKTVLISNAPKTVETHEQGSYQLWQLVLIFIISLILGAFLSSH